MEYEAMSIFWIIGIIVTVISAIVCPIIAAAKNRSAVGWFFGGLLLGGLGLIIVACLSSLKKEEDDEEEEDDEPYQFQPSNSDKIRELKEMLDEGLITKEEYEAKKRQILGL